MLLKDYYDVKITKANIEHYKKIYPNINLKDIIKVSTYDLPLKSNRVVRYQCDRCGEIFKTDYYTYNRHDNTIDSKTYCGHCKYEKIKMTNMKKYGVENVMYDPEIRKRNKQMILDKYGVENVFQSEEIKEKSKKTVQEKYGVDHIMHDPIIKKAVQEKSFKTLCENGNMTASNQQKYVCNLYGAILNYYVEKCCLDIYFNNSIYCEWNGSGHDIDVKYHKMSQEDFDKKEMRRYSFLKSKGYKLFEIVSRYDFVPSDEILLNMKQYAFKKLLEENYNWIRFDIDNNFVEYKGKKEKYIYK